MNSEDHAASAAAARLVLDFVPEQSEITRCGEAVSAFLSEAGLSDRIVYQIDVAVDELLTNIVKYAFEGGAGQAARLSVDMRETCIILEFVDRGRPFDPLNNAPAPDLSQTVEDRPIGGLGIHFVREMMDEVVYRREDGCNRLTLVKNRENPEAGQNKE